MGRQVYAEKLLSQVERPSEEIELFGETMTVYGPGYARSLDVTMVYRWFVLAPHLSVAASRLRRSLERKTSSRRTKGFTVAGSRCSSRTTRTNIVDTCAKLRHQRGQWSCRRSTAYWLRKAMRFHETARYTIVPRPSKHSLAAKSPPVEPDSRPLLYWARCFSRVGGCWR
jgi:hypothetical protein